MNTYNEVDRNGDGRLMAFVCGVLVGASAALLLAPMRGSELRASIGERSKHERDRLRRMSHEGRAWAEHTAQEAGEWAQSTARQANAKGRDVLNRATDAVDTAVDRAQSVVNQGAERAHEVTDRARTVLNRGLDNAQAAAQETGRRGADALAGAEDRIKEQWS